MLKETADRTTIGDHGIGVIEIISDLVANDLEIGEQTVSRHRILLGQRQSGEEVTSIRPDRIYCWPGPQAVGNPRSPPVCLNVSASKVINCVSSIRRVIMRAFPRQSSSERRRTVPASLKF